MSVGYTVLTGIRTQMQAQFATSTHYPARWELNIGEGVAESADAYTDYCCAGLAFVAIGETVPEPGSENRGNGGPLYDRMDIGFGVLRCAPTLSDQGIAPSVADKDAFAAIVLDDRDRLMRTMRAVYALPGMSEGDITDVAWNPIEQSGACGGGVVTLTIATIESC